MIYTFCAIQLLLDQIFYQQLKEICMDSHRFNLLTRFNFIIYEVPALRSKIVLCASGSEKIAWGHIWRKSNVANSIRILEFFANTF